MELEDTLNNNPAVEGESEMDPIQGTFPGEHLEPCPMCGSSARISDLGGWEVLCNDSMCGVAFELPDERHSDRAVTIAAWNRRAALSTREQADALDARRYRWLREKAVWAEPVSDDAPMVWCVVGMSAAQCWPVDGAELDARVDAAMNAKEPT